MSDTSGRIVRLEERHRCAGVIMDRAEDFRLKAYAAEAAGDYDAAIYLAKASSALNELAVEVMQDPAAS